LSKFGHTSIEKYSGYGINGKLSEWNAILGLAILQRNKGISGLISARKRLADSYDKVLSRRTDLVPIKPNKHVDWNYSYYPVVFQSETDMLKFKTELESRDIHCRRYFYPTTTVAYELNSEDCRKSEELSKRILCLPMGSNFTKKERNRIINSIKDIK
jgi:dTDP-4-amino-4,6-dideoxygalactose transaminase